MTTAATTAAAATAAAATAAAATTTTTTTAAAAAAATAAATAAAAAAAAVPACEKLHGSFFRTVAFRRGFRSYGDGDFGGVNVTFMTKLVNSLPESSLRAVAVGMTARSCGSK